MAEDGMLLNFSLGQTFGSNIQKFKGGSWRDRHQAKKNAQRGYEYGRRGQTNAFNQQVQNDSSQNLTEDFADSRPPKRPRPNEYNTADTNTSNSVALNNEHRPIGRKIQSNPEGVISSLFSYNPEPSTAREKREGQEVEATQTDPSNAPLTDGIDTFTSLGLTPRIAAHLLTKMSLKDPTAIQKATLLHMLKDDADTFIQSETGSGKTLAYLLPLVQHIMRISEQERVTFGTESEQNQSLQRSSGLFALILAPTRELCKQILVVLERLLGCAHYIVAGTVIGGEKKKSEKARLRKGLNILVATPGRLVDHLDNTKVLDISNVRWLVLDEGDRLMDLGFEEDITKIVKTLDQRKRLNSISGLPDKRTTVLCSATLKFNVQRLGEVSLKDAVLVKGDSDTTTDVDNNQPTNSTSAFLAPAQLKQSYLIVPAKLRLATLTALLRHTFGRKGSVMKAIVFVSCADSVEFHYQAFTRNEQVRTKEEEPEESSDEELQQQPPAFETTASIGTAHMLSAPENSITLHKLHGSLPQQIRTSIVKSFSTATTPSLLIATDVASRGLDLPNLDLVIEYDPAFSADDHLHRIGRTARLGRDGRAIIFLLPGKEEGYVDVLRNSYKKTDSNDPSHNIKQIDCNATLRKGFSPTSGIVSTSGSDWMTKATNFQLEVERWVLSSPQNKSFAKRAFQSHIRAYATHTINERKWFDIKELHLGHLAKAFGLRDKPSKMNVVGTRNAKENKRRYESTSGGKADGTEPSTNGDDAAKKMRTKIRNQQRMMQGGGADEFNIA